MIITVKCFLIPADITFNIDDVIVEFDEKDSHAVVVFNTESEDPIAIAVDKQHYFDEKNKK